MTHHPNHYPSNQEGGAEQAPRQQQQQIIPNNKPPQQQLETNQQSAETNPWRLKPVYRCAGQSAVDWCVRFHDTHQGTAYSDKDLSKIIDDVRGVDKDVQHLINTR